MKNQLTKRELKALQACGRKLYADLDRTEKPNPMTGRVEKGVSMISIFECAMRRVPSNNAKIESRLRRGAERVGAQLVKRRIKGVHAFSPRANRR